MPRSHLNDERGAQTAFQTLSKALSGGGLSAADSCSKHVSNVPVPVGDPSLALMTFAPAQAIVAPA
jgi:hypothetical protein